MIAANSKHTYQQEYYEDDNEGEEEYWEMLFLNNFKWLSFKGISHLVTHWNILNVSIYFTKLSLK